MLIEATSKPFVKVHVIRGSQYPVRKDILEAQKERGYLSLPILPRLETWLLSYENETIVVRNSLDFSGFQLPPSITSLVHRDKLHNTWRHLA